MSGPMNVPMVISASLCLRKVLGFLLIRFVDALPVSLAVPVVLDPPDGTPFLVVETACASRSRSLIGVLCGHSSGIATSETRINTAFPEAQRIVNAMRGPKGGKR